MNTAKSRNSYIETSVILYRINIATLRKLSMQYFVLSTKNYVTQTLYGPVW